MRLIFHGQLRELYGEYATMVTDVVADALEGFSRQKPDWPKHFPVHVVAGNRLLDSHETLAGYEDEVHLIPALHGGGGKWGSIIIGTIEIVAGIIMLSVPGMQALGISLIISGTIMVVQGVIQLFMKAPRMDKNQDPDASKYLAINKNTTAIGTPITMAWGRIDVAGHWLSLQSDSSNLSYGVFPTNPT
jgi:predicted phage tail protein